MSFGRADRGLSVVWRDDDGGAGLAWWGVARQAQAFVGTAAFTLWWQVRGESTVVAGDCTLRLAAGEWLALEGGTQPCVASGPHALLLGVRVPADAVPLLETLAGCALFAGRGTLARRERRMALRVWRNVMRSTALPGLAGDARARMLLPLLQLTLLQREPMNALRRCPGRTQVHRSQVFGRLQRARLFIEGNSDRNVTLPELARLTHFSVWYLSKTFLSTYGETPLTISRRVRLERAARLLSDSPLAIGEVALACGFDNACSFARAFRGHHGMTASDYRARHGAGRAVSANACGHRGPRAHAAAPYRDPALTHS